MKRNKNALDKIKYTKGSKCINEMIEDINKNHSKVTKTVNKK